jgi:Predicted NADH:ubiquinone oxidoreductase, subunit RnfG
MSKTWEDILKPVVVLTIICFVTATALAYTNNVTAPIIAANNAGVADAARIELLPDADSFTQIEYEGAGIVEIYVANNGAGYVITATQKGYDGEVPVMVAFNADGIIVNVRVLDNTETPGLGKKVEDASFTGQFIGFEAREIRLGADIDNIAGATISSGAVVDAVNYANAAYNEVALGVVVTEPTEEDYVAELLPEGETATLFDTPIDGVNAVYIGDAGTTVIIAQADGYNGVPLTVYVAITEDGVISNLKVDATGQTKGLGTKVEDESFVSQFIGLDDVSDVEIIADATISSNAVIKAVDVALVAYSVVKGA